VVNYHEDVNQFTAGQSRKTELSNEAEETRRKVRDPQATTKMTVQVDQLTKKLQRRAEKQR